MRTDPSRRREKTFAPRLEPPLRVRPRRARPARAPARPVVDPTSIRPSDSGQPLAPEVLRRLQDSLGRPLAHVRIHAAPADRQRAHDLGARAFTHRHHIWLGPHESPSDLGLIAHEVTHVVQQGFAPAPAAGWPAVPAAAPPAAPGHEQAPSARAPAPRGHAAPAAAAAPARPAVAAVQRLDFDPFGAARRAASAVASGVSSAGRAVVRGARVVGGAIVETGAALLSRGRDAVLSFVEEISPGFAQLFRDGIGGFIRRLVERGLRSMFSGLSAPFRGILNFGAIGDRIGQAVSWIGAIVSQLANNDCSGILAAARRVSAFFSSVLQPVFDKIRDIADKVTGFFRGIWDAIGAPIMDMLKKIGGRIWDSLKGFVRDVRAAIQTVREALGDAWDTVKGWLGIRAEEGEEEGGGLWEWIKEKATSVGESISNVIRPVIGPLRTVGAVLLLIVPGGQILAIMLMWPRLRQAWDWLSQKWTDLNLIPRARHFLHNTVIPALMSAAESVGQALVRAADWLLGLLERVAGSVMTAVNAATGILSPLATLILNYAHQQFQRFVNWARGGLRFVSVNMRSLLQQLIRFLGLVLQALGQLIAIAVNPFGIVGFLMGTIWRLIPECLKGPIIDFIIEVILRILRALPPLPMLGLLWPLIKAAALGFFEKVKSFAIERKVAVSNKMARIISGMSPSFAFGYLRGLGLGLWAEITGPFQALATLFELPSLIQNFLSSLGIRLCELIEKIRCFAANLAGQVFGTLDEVLSGLGELFGDPSKVIDLIRCAIEGALAGAASLGASIADRLMQVFESADDAIGEGLGRITASALVQAAMTYFTAGVGNTVSIVGRIGNALRTVGRAVNQVLGMLRGLLGRLFTAVRGLASRLARGAASGGRSVLGRLGGFIRRVGAWFGRLFARIGRGLRRRFGLSARERIMWGEFRGRVTAALSGHPEGMTRANLRRTYGGIVGSHRPVAKWPSFITKHGPKWRVWVRKVKTLRPRIVGRVLLDRVTRWKQGKKAVKAAIRKLKRRPGNIDDDMIDGVLGRIRERYKYDVLDASFQEQRNRFVVDGHMSPGRIVAVTGPKRPTHNVVASNSPSRSIRIYPLVAKHSRTSPSGSPPHWAEVVKIKTARGTSLYRRGHLASGHFAGGGAENLTPITFAANSTMAARAETPVKKALPSRAKSDSPKPIFDYRVRAHGRPSGLPPRRLIEEGDDEKCTRVSAERRLFSTISISISAYGYNKSSKKWDRAVSLPAGASPGDVANVPPWPTGRGEPCS
jgi:phage-related protein